MKVFSCKGKLKRIAVAHDFTRYKPLAHKCNDSLIRHKNSLNSSVWQRQGFFVVLDKCHIYPKAQTGKVTRTVFFP